MLVNFFFFILKSVYKELEKATIIIMNKWLSNDLQRHILESKVWGGANVNFIL